MASKRTDRCYDGTNVVAMAAVYFLDQSLPKLFGDRQPKCLCFFGLPVLYHSSPRGYKVLPHTQSAAPIRLEDFGWFAGQIDAAQMYGLQRWSLALQRTHSSVSTSAHPVSIQRVDSFGVPAR